MNDPIADFLTRIRNGITAKKPAVVVPKTKMNQKLLKILYSEGYITNYRIASAPNLLTKRSNDGLAKSIDLTSVSKVRRENKLSPIGLFVPSKLDKNGAKSSNKNTKLSTASRSSSLLPKGLVQIKRQADENLTAGLSVASTDKRALNKNRLLRQLAINLAAFGYTKTKGTLTRIDKSNILLRQRVIKLSLPTSVKVKFLPKSSLLNKLKGHTPKSGKTFRTNGGPIGRQRERGVNGRAEALIKIQSNIGLNTSLPRLISSCFSLNVLDFIKYKRFESNIKSIFYKAQLNKYAMYAKNPLIFNSALLLAESALKDATLKPNQASNYLKKSTSSIQASALISLTNLVYDIRNAQRRSNQPEAHSATKRTQQQSARSKQSSFSKSASGHANKRLLQIFLLLNGKAEGQHRNVSKIDNLVRIQTTQGYISPHRNLYSSQHKALTARVASLLPPRHKASESKSEASVFTPRAQQRRARPGVLGWKSIIARLKELLSTKHRALRPKRITNLYLKDVNSKNIKRYQLQIQSLSASKSAVNRLVNQSNLNVKQKIRFECTQSFSFKQSLLIPLAYSAFILNLSQLGFSYGNSINLRHYFIATSKGVNTPVLNPNKASISRKQSPLRVDNSSLVARVRDAQDLLRTSIGKRKTLLTPVNFLNNPSILPLSSKLRPLNLFVRGRSIASQRSKLANFRLLNFNPSLYNITHINSIFKAIQKSYLARFESNIKLNSVLKALAINKPAVDLSNAKGHLNFKQVPFNRVPSFLNYLHLTLAAFNDHKAPVSLQAFIHGFNKRENWWHACNSFVHHSTFSTNNLTKAATRTQQNKPYILVTLKYVQVVNRGSDSVQAKSVISEIIRVSKPSRRVYTSIKSLPYLKKGLGLQILSTPKGILSDVDAKKYGVGGEILCKIF